MLTFTQNHTQRSASLDSDTPLSHTHYYHFSPQVLQHCFMERNDTHNQAGSGPRMDLWLKHVQVTLAMRKTIPLGKWHGDEGTGTVFFAQPDNVFLWLSSAVWVQPSRPLWRSWGWWWEPPFLFSCSMALPTYCQQVFVEYLCDPEHTHGLPGRKQMKASPLGVHSLGRAQQQEYIAISTCPCLLYIAALRSYWLKGWHQGVSF